MELTTFVESFR